MSHKLFNINTKDEWNEYLVPKLKLLISVCEDGEMITVGESKEPILSLDLDNYSLEYLGKDGYVQNLNFTDFFILDEDDRLQHQKTQFLKELYTELFTIKLKTPWQQQFYQSKSN